MFTPLRGVWLLLAVLLVGTVPGCRIAETASPPSVAPARFEILRQQTVPGVGAAQGVAVHDGFVYIYGDADTGVIRQYRFDSPSPGQPIGLTYTGVELRLTRHGEDLLPHPTGLTWHPRFGCFIGDTVNQRGTIWYIDWDRLLADGNLDRAVLNRTDDDLAVNGCRPEFVRVGVRWLVATADYGDAGNRVRLYDPAALAGAPRTSEPGVLWRSSPSGPFVQTMTWLDGRATLVLNQNQVAGLRYRFTFARLDGAGSLRPFASTDLDEPTDELEGFTPVGDGYFVMVSAMRENNVTLGRLHWTD